MFRIRFFILLLFIPGVVAGEEGRNPSFKPIGQVVGGSAVMDGIPVPAGTTLFSDSLLRTGPQPASIRLNTGDLLQLNGNSAAYFQSLANGQIQVAVNSGTLSYRPITGQPTTTVSPAAVSFPQRRTGKVIPAVSQQAGVVALLTARAGPGEVRLLVNDTSRFNPEARTMIKTRDGQIHEVHYLRSVGKNEIILKTPLIYTFQPEDMVIQGCECDDAVGAPADGIVALLTAPIKKGEKSVTINTLAMVDPEATTLVKRRDGSIQEVHHVESFSGNVLTFKEGMKYEFLAGDQLIQGCSVPPFMGLGWPWKRAVLAGLAPGGTTTYVTATNPEENPCSLCERPPAGVE